MGNSLVLYVSCGRWSAATTSPDGGVSPSDREGDGAVVVETGPRVARRLHDKVICSAIVLHGTVRINIIFFAI